MCDDNGRKSFSFMCFQNEIGEALRCSGDGITVHPVAACTDNAAQTAGTEFQVTVKAFFQFFGIIA
ncbi:hypothetical protein D3C73_1611220 [compost metagenome]